MAFVNGGAEEPSIEPSIQRDVAFQESLKGGRQDGGEVGRNEEGLVERKEDRYDVEDSSSDENVLVMESRAQS